MTPGPPDLLELSWKSASSWSPCCWCSPPGACIGWPQSCGSHRERHRHHQPAAGGRPCRLSLHRAAEAGEVPVSANGTLQILLFLAVLLLLVKPLGLFMARLYEGERTLLSPVLGWLERLVYRVIGVDSRQEQDWKQYAGALLAFNVLGFLFVYLLQRLQGVLPLNPQAFGAVSPDLAFNTAVSFATNTNWQGYGGETTMSYLTQMLALGVQNFVSAGSGMAVLVALIRGFARRET